MSSSVPNHGGTGSGLAEVAFPKGVWQAEDALSWRPDLLDPADAVAGVAVWGAALWTYRIIRLHR